MKRRAKSNERGFALLLVFLMASAVALMLYRQMPREAFESERDKEQMLIDRGEQYKRAIYLFYVSNNRQWPAKVEDLENTNNHRYLRHRYIDPYTGKSEWRLVHTNGAFLTDSLVTPPPAQAAPGAPGAGALGNASMVASSTATITLAPDPNAPPDVNVQALRRASDRTLAQNSDFQNLPGSSASQGNDPGYQPFNPAALPPVSMYPNGYNAPPVNMPGMNGPLFPNQQGFNQPGGINQPGINPQPVGTQLGLNQPGMNQPGVNQPGVNLPGVPGFTIPGTNLPVTTQGFNPSSPINNPNFQQGVNSAPAGNQPFPGQDPNQFNASANAPPPFAPGVPGVPGAPGAPPSNQALGFINQLLTTPRVAPTTTGQQTQTGGGLAGVASTYKGTSIKSYGDRTKYQEWEFVFQLNPQGNLQAPQGVGANGKNGPPTSSGPLGTGTSASPASGTPAPGGSATGGASPSSFSGGFGTN